MGKLKKFWDSLFSPVPTLISLKQSGLEIDIVVSYDPVYIVDTDGNSYRYIGKGATAEGPFELYRADSNDGFVEIEIYDKNVHARWVGRAWESRSESR